MTSLNAPITVDADFVTISLVFSGLKISFGMLLFKAFDSSSYKPAKEEEKEKNQPCWFLAYVMQSLILLLGYLSGV